MAVVSSGTQNLSGPLGGREEKFTGGVHEKYVNWPLHYGRTGDWILW